MASLNKVLLIGNLTRDPELRYTPKGAAVASCGLAINRRYKNEAGEEMEEVTFVDFAAWGRTAEALAQYQKKGGLIMIEGRLKLDQWEDKQSGENRQKLKVVAELIQFLGGKPKDGDEPATEKPTGRRQASAPAHQPASNSGPEDDDPIPF